MNVIGNDLVNLKNRDNINTIKRSGFRNFFTTDELHFADEHNGTKCLTCMWAIKGSAYKCIIKLGYKVAFSPAKYHITACCKNSKITGTVSYKNETLYIKCIEDGEFIRCIVSNNSEKVNQIKSIHLKNTSHIYSDISSKISKFTNTNNLIFKKIQNNIPVIFNEQNTHFLEISLSKEDDLYFVSVLPEWEPITNPIKSFNSSSNIV
jgi:phosphopantetheinyl transferase (holo-ACP synthase)